MAMQRVEMPLGKYTLSIETGRMAKQSDGAVLVRLGDTVVLSTANALPDAKAGVDFLPLTVDYRENTYAAGKIPGGFFKREGRPNEKEILTSRMIDRPLRPLFPEGYNKETQVIGLLLSADMENDSDTLAIIGASAALTLSSIPFHNPVGAVRVGYWDEQVVVNPSSGDLRTKSKLNLLVAGTEDAIVMVESGAQEISEEVMVRALAEGHAVIKQIVALQKQLQQAGGQAEVVLREEGARPRLRDLGRGADGRAAAGRHADEGQARVLRGHEEGQGRPHGPPARGGGGQEGDGPRASTTACARRSCAARSWRTAAATTGAASTRSAPSTARSASSRAPTARRCSPAARPRPW